MFSPSRIENTSIAFSCSMDFKTPPSGLFLYLEQSRYRMLRMHVDHSMVCTCLHSLIKQEGIWMLVPC